MRSSLSWLLAVSISCLLTCVSTAQTKDEVKLTPIKAADLEKAIAAHKGKVVIIDVWGEF